MNKIINILLIEDSKTQSLVFEKHLREISNGFTYNLTIALSYQDGLHFLINPEHKFDLCYADYHLDRDTSYELIKDAVFEGAQCPFIILTADSDEKLYKKFSEIASVFDFLVKSELSTYLLERSISYALRRRDIEQALIEEKAFSENIINEAPYMILTVNNKGEIASVNPAVTKVSKYTHNELIGQNWKFMIVGSEQINYYTHDDDYTGFQSQIQCKNGDLRTINWNIIGKSLTSAQPSGVRFILTGKDITDDLQKEAQRRQEDKMKALGQLAGGMAHEINNLLQPVILGGELLYTKINEDNDKKICEKIIRNSKHAGKIVHDVLTFSRKDNDSGAIEPIEVYKIFEQCFEIVNDGLPDEVHVQIDCSDKLKTAKCRLTATDVERVLGNMLLNAAQAMDDKGVIELNLDTINSGAAEFKHLNDRPYFKMVIKDSGTGIPKNKIDEIFIPFYTTKSKGTGLGLSIAYNIIESWNGHIEVQSEPGKTVFSIYVPLC